MSDEIDDLLKVVIDKQPVKLPKEEKPKFKLSKTAKIILAVILSIAILLTIFLKIRSNNIEKQVEEQNHIALVKKKKKEEAKKKAQKIESQYFLSKSEYKSNIKILTDGNIGLVADKEKGLVGKIKFASGKRAEILSYSRKTGEIHAIDDKFNPVTYDDKWVQTLIAKIKAIKSNSKIASEQEQSNDKEKTKESVSSSKEDN